MSPGVPSGVNSVARTGEISLADGRILRLAGIDWPTLDRQAERTRLRTALVRLAEGASVVSETTAKPDRWGRVVAQVFLHVPNGPPQPLWLQETVLALGLARAWPEAGLVDCWTPMLAAEARARQQGLGLWSPLHKRQNRLARRTTAAVSERVFFEGRVFSVRTGRTATFVNFTGPRSTTPFLLLRNRDLAVWRNVGLDPATFSGKRLMVRGALMRGTLRRLEVSGPMAVEVLE